MSQMSHEEAVAAIQADVQAQGNADDDGMPPYTPPDQVTEPTPVDTDTGTPEADDVTPPADDSTQGLPEWNLSIDQLPDELKPLAKSLQADYTRKTQKAAELMRPYEDFGDPDSVAQAVALARAFESDPVGTHRKIQEALSKQGLWKDDATPPPTPQAVEVESPLLARLAQEEGTDSPLYLIAKQVHDSQVQFEAERSKFLEDQNQAEEQRLEREQNEYFARTDIALRKAHDNWEDTDMDYVYDLAFSTGGDLEQGATKYEEIGNRAIAQYLLRKGGLATGSGSVGSTAAGGQPPQAPKTLAEGHAAAREELEALAAAGEFSLGGDY